MTTGLYTYRFRLQNRTTLERTSVQIVAKNKNEATVKFHEIQELENYEILNITFA